ncbi:MAG TPA: ABC transporter permease, partial [Bacteroidia bacterium]
MNVANFIAKRYLFSRPWWAVFFVPWWLQLLMKSRNAVNIIIGISITGITAGAFALIVVLSAFNGISNLVFGLYNTFDPDIKITPKEGKTFIPNADFEKIKKMKEVSFYTEVLQENALIKYDDKQMIATIKGVNDDFVKMTRLDTVVREGNFLLRHDSVDYAVLGYGIAHKLNISLTDFMNPLEIYVPKRGKQSYLNPEDAFIFRSVEVSGVFSLNDDFDYRYCIIPLSLARTLLNRKNELSFIELGLGKGEDKENVKNEIKNIL